MRRILSMILLLILTPFLAADARIKVKDRIPNSYPGYCVWCSLETLGRHQGVKGLFGLTDWYKRSGLDGGAAERQVQRQLDMLGIRHRQQWGGTYDSRSVKRSCQEGNGCVVGFVGRSYGHAVILTAWRDGIVRYVDPNWPAWDMQASAAWYLQNWDGWAVFLEQKDAD